MEHQQHGQQHQAVEMLRQLEAALSELHSPSCTAQRRRGVESDLAQFRESWPGAAESSVHLLGLAVANDKDATASVPAVHFLCSVIEHWGGDLGRLELHFASPSSGEAAAREKRLGFVAGVRNLLLNVYLALADLDANSGNSGGGGDDARQRRQILTAARNQLTVAYCRMLRCAWGNADLLPPAADGDPVLDACSSVETSSDEVLASAGAGSAPVVVRRGVLGQAAFGSSVLATLCEELSRDDRAVSSPLSSRRRAELRTLMGGATPRIVSSVSRALDAFSSLSSISTAQQRAAEADDGGANGTNNNAVESGIVQNCLRCVGAVLAFPRSVELRSVDAAAAVSVDLLRSLFGAIDRAAAESSARFVSGDSARIVDRGSDSVEIVAEVVARGCWPPGEAEAYVMEVGRRTMQSLSAVVDVLERSATSGAEHASDCVPRFRSQLTNFLDSFCANQLGRAASLAGRGGLPSDYVSEFLRLMARYTFALPRGEELAACLAPWSRVADYTESLEGTAGADFAARHGEGLSAVLAAAIQANFFATNSSRLVHLDGGELEFVPVSPLDDDEGGPRGGDDDDDDGDSTADAAAAAGPPSSSLSPAVDAALRSTELGELLAETCALSSSLCSVSPRCALVARDELVARLGDSLSKLHLVGGDDAQSPPPPTGEERRRLCWDASAAARLLEGGGNVAAAALSHELGLGPGDGDRARRMADYRELCNGVAQACQKLLSRGGDEECLVHLFHSCCGCLAALGGGIANLARYGDGGGDRDIRASAEDVMGRILDLCGGALASFRPYLILPPRQQQQQQPQPQPPPQLSLYLAGICDLVQRSADALSSTLLSPRVILASGGGVANAVFLTRCRSFVSAVLPTAANDGRLHPQFESHSRLLYRASVGLTFSFGRVENLNVLVEAGRALYTEQAEAFVALVARPLCDDLARLGAEAKAATAGSDPMMSLRQCNVSVRQACEHLATVCDEVDAGMGDGARTVLSGAIGGSMGDALDLLEIFAVASSSSRGEEAGMIAALSSLLNLQVSVITCLKKQVGVEYQSKAVSVVLSTFSSAGGATSAATNIMVNRALVRLLIATFGTRDSKVSSLLPQTCELLQERIFPLCTSSSNAPELFPLVLKLLHRVFTMHWKYFVKTVVEGGSPDIGIGGSPLMGPSAFLGKRVSRITDPERFRQFQLLLQVMLDTFKASDMPPSVTARAIAILRDLGTSLYKVEQFVSTLKPAFLATIMECLLARNQPVLVDELSMLLFDIANSDMDDFFRTFLPNLVQTMPLNEEGKASVMQSWSPSERDASSFCAGCQDFLSEYRYLVNRNQVVVPTR